MKIKGRVLDNDLVDYVVIPRNDGDVVFKVVPVTDWKTFEELCPLPTPKVIQKPGGVKEQFTDDPDYQAAMLKRNSLRYFYLLINSLAQTEGLEWDLVKLGDPDTWNSIDVELASLSNIERGMIYEAINRVNSMDEEYLKKARDSFLATLPAANK